MSFSKIDRVVAVGKENGLPYVEVALAPGTPHSLHFDPAITSTLIAAFAFSGTRKVEASSSDRLELGRLPAIPCRDVKAMARKDDLDHFVMQFTTSGNVDLSFHLSMRDVPSIIAVLQNLHKQAHNIDPRLN